MKAWFDVREIMEIFDYTPAQALDFIREGREQLINAGKIKHEYPKEIIPAVYVKEYLNRFK